MRRRRGQTLIETWAHHRYKETTNIYLDKDSGEFHAEYAEEDLSSKSLEEIRSKLTKLVEETVVLDWIPIVQITMGGSVHCSMDKPISRTSSTNVQVDEYDERRESGEAELDLDFKRYWIAKRPDGKWLTCHIWHSQDDGGKSDRYDPKRDHFHAPTPRRLNSTEFWVARNNKDFSLPWTEKASAHERGDTHYVRYTEELWDGLNEIARRMDQLRERLETIVGSDKGRAQLVSNLTKMLPLEKAK